MRCLFTPHTSEGNEAKESPLLRNGILIEETVVALQSHTLQEGNETPVNKHSACFTPDVMEQ